MRRGIVALDRAHVWHPYTPMGGRGFRRRCRCAGRCWNTWTAGVIPTETIVILSLRSVTPTRGCSVLCSTNLSARALSLGRHLTNRLRGWPPS